VKKNTLTKTEEQALLQCREEYYGIGSACGATDRTRTAETISAIYRLTGQNIPRFIWCASPATALLGIASFLNQASLGDSLGDSLRESLGASLGNPLGASLRASLWEALWASLRNSLGDSLRNSLWESLRNSLWDPLGASLRAVWRRGLYGQHEAYWIAFYKFAMQLGVGFQPKDQTLLNYWDTLARSCGWWFPYRNICFVADRPMVLRVDEQRRLHCSTGPAMAFADGYAIWAWHGVRVSQHVIEDPATLNIEDIRMQKNAEVRRVMIERYGWDTFMDQCGADLIAADTDPVGAPGLRGLFRMNSGEHVLVCSCASSGHTFYLEVPPEVSTCQQAANWLANAEQQGLQHMLFQT